MLEYKPERELDIETSKQLWLEVIDKHQLQCMKKNYSANGFTITLCFLTEKNLTVRGAGKGFDAAAIDVSASYEAIEFYLSSFDFHSYPIILKNLKEISNQYPVIFNRCNPDKFKTIAKQSCSLPWVIYENIKNNEKHAVPLASVDLNYSIFPLQHDAFDYAACELYAASNGLASGGSYEESVIHGTLEILERDAYSYFLIDTYILKKPPLIVKQQTLADDIQELINEIESKINNQIIIFEMPSRFGVHVYLATFLNREFEIQPRGAGASLNKKYALERAIFELTQTHLLMHGWYVDNAISKKNIGKNKLIKDFIEFDVHEIIKSRHYEEVDFNDNSEETNHMPLSKYLDQLINLIHQQSSSLLVNTVYKHQNGLTCTRTIIPDAEEFFLATHYMKLEPKINTHLYIESQLGEKFYWDNFE